MTTKKLTRLPQNIERETLKAICFASCRVNDDGFWVPRSLVTSEWTNTNGEVVEESDPSACWFTQYVPTWFIAKNNLWSKLQGSEGF